MWHLPVGDVCNLLFHHDKSIPWADGKQKDELSSVPFTVTPCGFAPVIKLEESLQTQEQAKITFYGHICNGASLPHGCDSEE
jgi:hypothetical protein